MKITAIRTGIVNLPADEPLAGAAANPNGKRPIVWVRVGTDSGAEGIGVAYFGGALTGTLRHAIDELGALLVGDDPQLTEAIQSKLKNAAGGSAGPGGIYNLALSALDIAMWDLKAKAVDLPLWKLLGGGRATVPTYASGRVDARPVARPRRQGRRHAEGKGLARDEDAARAARRDQPARSRSSAWSRSARRSAPTSS